MATDTPDAPPADAVNITSEPVKLPQDVVITDAGPCKKHVKVTVHRAAIDTRLDEKFTGLMVEKPAQIPGFRPGKAPRKIVEKKFFKEVSGEVRTEVLMASLEQLAEEEKLSPLSPPELDPGSVVIPPDGPLVYEFDIEVRPEFDLPPYKGLALRRPTHTFTDAEIAREGDRMLEPYGQVVAKDGGAELDDLVTADIAIKAADGRVLNTLPDVKFRVEKRLALADGVAETFSEQLSGAKVGDTRDVTITLGQDVPAASLRGTTVTAGFTVKEVKRVQRPELTPEVLEAFDVRTPDQFTELVRTRLDRYMEYLQRQEARKQVMDKLAGGVKWELPRDLLVRQARRTMQRRMMEMKSAGMSDEQILGRRRVLENDALRSTTDALKEHFVLQKIAEAEKLEIEDADIDAEIDRIADQSGESPRKVRARMERDDLIEALATELLERKALDHLLAEATYEDYELNPTEADDGDVATVEGSVAPAGEPEPAANG
jgi:trigger factor